MNRNHPNRRRLPYRIKYGAHEAAFSDPDEAQTFALWASGRHPEALVDVMLTHGEGRGLVGQYKSGRGTPEFGGVAVVVTAAERA